MKTTNQPAVTMTAKQKRIYGEHFAACQAGGMSNGDAHEYAMDLATREQNASPAAKAGQIYAAEEACRMAHRKVGILAARGYPRGYKSARKAADAAARKLARLTGGAS